METTFQKAIDILYAARQKGVEILLNNDKLQLKIDENQEIDEDLLQRIRQNKQLLIDFLSEDGWKSKQTSEEQEIITPFNREEVSQIPLSFSQERLWFIDQLEGSIQYHLPAVLQLRGTLDTNALSQAFKAIVDRHEVLRTVIAEEGGVGYQVINSAENWELAITVNELYINDGTLLQSYIRERIMRPFDLSSDYMLRAELIQLAEREHILLLNMHHIASDAWSISIIVKEVTALYEAYRQGHTLPLPPLTLQYSDYSLWQRRGMSGALLEEKLHYWKNKLNEVEVLELPTDYVRPVVQSTNGAMFSLNVGQTLKSQLKDFSLSRGVSLYMTMLSAFKVLLYRYSGQEDICVGTSIAGRPQPSLEKLVGFFVNTIALRDKLSGDMAFHTLLDQVKSSTLEAYANVEVPFEKVVEAVINERDPARSPLFQVMLVMGNTPEVPELRLNDLVLTSLGQELTAVKFDLTFFLTETPSGLTISVQYSTALYKPERIDRMVNHYINLLTSSVTNPADQISRLEMLNDTEVAELTNGINVSSSNYLTGKSILDYFQSEAMRSLDFAAVEFEGEKLSYAALEERSNQLANYLIGRGIQTNSLVPLYIERGLEMIIGILGILKSGGAYVPIDTGLPEERLHFMLEDTKATLVVSSSANSPRLMGSGLHIIELDQPDSSLKNQLTSLPSVKILPNHLAYVIYTSGSTGVPKGVLVEHGQLLDYTFGLNSRININSCSSYALVSTIATDLGNTVLYSWLVSGGTLHVFSKDTVSDANALHDYFRRHQIDCLKIVPSHWQALMLDGEPLLSRRLLIFGGETLTGSQIETIRESGTRCRIINHYGPTETTIGKLLHEVDLEKQYGEKVPIGKPFSNTQVYVLSADNALCPVGVPGQLFIGGSGVSRGYLNNEKLNQEKFTTDPFHQDTFGRFYKTGDLVRYLPGGDIEFMGRVDDQVKIRGYRVEPGEVSRVLEQNVDVKQAVTIAYRDKFGSNQLVAYVVPSQLFDSEALLCYLRASLPDYMVPTHLISLESLPLTANGKIDRRSLPDPELGSQPKVGGYTAPVSATQERLVEIWADILEVEQVGLHDDFFELGGHSLLAVRLLSAIRKKFSAELAISDIFDYPTVGQLAAHLDKDDQKVDVLPGIEVIQPRPEHIPLSFSQERLWFIDQLGGSRQYHIPAVLRLTGKLDTKALQQALKAIIERHEILRTVVRQEEGQGYQHIRSSDEWQLNTTPGEVLTQDQLEALIEQQITAPFDLSADYMLRAELIEQQEEKHILVVTMHHIASDGWSRPILVNEVAELYRSYTEGRQAALAPLPIQYADYAMWQRSHLQAAILENKLEYWKKKLLGVSPLQLPTDNSRPAQQGIAGATYNFKLEGSLSNQIKELSLSSGATLYMTLLSAFKILLFRYSGQEDICVGSPVAGRSHQEIEGLIGFFVNTLPLRSELNGQISFRDVLERVKATTLEAYSHQEVPFERIVEGVVKERDQSRSPLFQVMFLLQNTPDVPELRLGEVTIAGVNIGNASSKFDLTFGVVETPGGLQCYVEYSTELYSQETIIRMAEHYQNLLSSIGNNPESLIGDLEMLTASEEQQLLQEFNAKKTTYHESATIISLFEEQVRQRPGATAIVFEEERLSYQELNDRSNQLAHYLQRRGCGPESLVPLCLLRSSDMIICILGILKAGAAYVPVDPDYPADRINYMLQDSGCNMLLSSTSVLKHLALSYEMEAIDIEGDSDAIARESIENLPLISSPRNLAYVIYTSGSTGKPKGVMVEHTSVVNLIQSQIEPLHLRPGISVFQFASLSFDASCYEIFCTLLCGGKLVLASKDTLLDASALKGILSNQKVELITLPPSYQSIFEEEVFDLKTIVSAGEALNAEYALALREKGVRVINAYGPTENTICAALTDEPITSNGAITIGKPISNVEIFILGVAGELLPVGVTGELHIGGPQLARGYLNRNELTKERFIPNPFDLDPKGRLYKTGDVARWLPDGNIEYLGRIDDQVKIRGYRIEPGEIESLIQQSGLVKQAVVLARGQDLSKYLVGYVIWSAGATKDILLSYLQRMLPEYMIPGFWVELESFPLTTSGKIDRKALSEPEMVNTITSQAYVAPGTDFEAGVVRIWERLLHQKRVGIEDNFFDLGGHSLLAMRVIASIRKEFGNELNIKDLFVYPTIAGLSNRLMQIRENQTEDFNSEVLVPIKTGGFKDPLYFICGAGGTVFTFKIFSEYLDKNQPVYGLQQPTEIASLESFPNTLEGIASKYIEEILRQNPSGPYALAGHCHGGTIAFEMARQLKALKKMVTLVSLIDTVVTETPKKIAPVFSNFFNLRSIARKAMVNLGLKVHFEYFLIKNHPRQALKYKINKLQGVLGPVSGKEEDRGVFTQMENILQEAALKYQIKDYDGDILAFYAKDHYYFLDKLNNIAYGARSYDEKIKMAWNEYANAVKIYELEGEHSTIFTRPYVKRFAEIMQAHLDRKSIWL
jgi:amino acid adenylation domain-containing protein